MPLTLLQPAFLHESNSLFSQGALVLCCLCSRQEVNNTPLGVAFSAFDGSFFTLNELSASFKQDQVVHMKRGPSVLHIFATTTSPGSVASVEQPDPFGSMLEVGLPIEPANLPQNAPQRLRCRNISQKLQSFYLWMEVSAKCQFLFLTLPKAYKILNLLGSSLSPRSDIRTIRYKSPFQEKM